MAAPSPWPKRRQRGLLVAVGVSAASLLALAASSRRAPADLLGDLGRLDAGLVALALLLHAGLWVAWAARLRILAGAVGVRIGYAASLRGVLAGSFAASVTPAMLGGEAVRGYVLARQGRQVGAAGAAILAERLLDMLVFLAGGAAFAALYAGVVNGPVAVALAAAMLLLGLGLAMVALAAARPALVRRACERLARWAARGDAAKGARWQLRAGDEFDKFRTALAVLARRPRALAAAATLTGVMWMSEMGVLWVLLQAFGATLPFPLVALGGLLLLLVMATPLAPGGSGVAEVGAAAVFGALVPGLSPLFPAVWRGCTFYVNLAVGGWAAADLWRSPVIAAATAPQAAR